jgi:hypothetical protein
MISSCWDILKIKPHMEEELRENIDFEVFCISREQPQQ